MHILHILAIQLLVIGKYGLNEINKKFNKTTQELCSYKLKFNFKTDSGILDYLNGKKITI